MYVLVAESVVKCAHGGIVGIKPSQNLVFIEEVPMLVEPDLVDRPISACPHTSGATPPCLVTVSVEEGPTYASFVRIEGRRLCKDSLSGKTDWSKLSLVPFNATDARQTLVSVSE